MKYSLIALLGCLLLSACKEDVGGGSLSTTSGGGSSSSSSSSSSTSSAASTSYAYLEIYASLVSGAEVGEEELLDTCEVPTGTIEGTVIDCPNFNYDESKLYNSRLRFAWGTNDTTACPYLKFYPYYYRASNSATFHPEWVSPLDLDVDCSAPNSLDSVNCYGGAAPQMTASLNFPSIDYFFNITALSQSGEVEITSSRELSRRSNRMASNPDPTYVIGSDRIMFDGSDGIVTAFGGGYTGDLVTLSPYSVVCEDAFADPLFTLNYYLRDYDVSGTPPSNSPDNATLNDYPDWDSTLNTLDPQ
ncbi:MAG: hypothetical protein R3A80_13390 [Bdellovibrionota bacterium]